MSIVHDSPLIIEVAVNGATRREEHPAVPLSSAEIVAQARECAAAGAAVIHAHGRTADGGWAFGDAAAYRAVFAELRGKDGLVVYPTMLGTTGDPAARFAHVEALGGEQLLDWAPVDCGTTYLIGTRNVRLAESGFAYQNPVEDNRHAHG